MALASAVGVLTALLVASEPPPASLTPTGAAPDLGPPPDAGTAKHDPLLRTALETTVLLGLGTLWYWRSPSLSDRDLGFNWGSWKSKLTSTNQLVFDNNFFDTNAASHPRAGTAYYQIARGNGLGFGGSFASSFLASTVWEYLSEFIERPSINDLIFTPVGGTVIGEATYQVGRYFASAPSANPLEELGALVFSPVATVNEWSAARAGRTGAGGAPSIRPRRSWHRFDLNVGLSRTVFSEGPGRDEAMLALGDRIVTERSYMRPGKDRSSVRPGQWTEMAARVYLDEARASGIDFHAHTTLWGRYTRDYLPPEPGLSSGAQGWSLLTALASSFDYDTRNLPGFQDRTASVGLVGPLVELDRRRGDSGLRATLGARYGLGMVQSLAYPGYAAIATDWSTISVLREQGYYYAQALLTTASLAYSWTRAEAALLGRMDAFWSIDGRDRFAAKVHDAFSLSDQRAMVGASLAGQPWPAPIRVVTAVERLIRAGQLLDRAITSVESRATVSAAVAF